MTGLVPFEYEFLLALEGVWFPHTLVSSVNSKTGIRIKDDSESGSKPQTRLLFDVQMGIGMPKGRKSGSVFT